MSSLAFFWKFGIDFGDCRVQISFELIDSDWKKVKLKEIAE